MEMSSRRAVSQIARRVSRTRAIAASGRRPGVVSNKSTSRKMKRSGYFPEGSRPSEVHTASWLTWEKWPAIVLLSYTIAWCMFVASFING